MIIDAIVAGAIGVACVLAFNIITDEMEVAARSRRIVRNSERLARKVEGWKR